MSTVVTTKSWGGRLKNAFGGILFGLILIIGSLIFIFWNEGSSLHTAQSLKQTQQVVIDVPNTPVDTNNSQKVVHFTGLATTDETLKDPILGISAAAIRLNRNVQMYQWKEKSETKTEKNFGGSETETTTYTYNTVWSPDVINSSEFHQQEGHQNPERMAIPSRSQQAEVVTVGDFNLPRILIDQISGDTAVDLSQVDIDALKSHVGKPVSYANEELYVGTNSQQPQVGDLRITMTKVEPQTVSVIAQQTGETVQAYKAPAGKDIALLQMGEQTSQEMIQTAEEENRMTTWFIRIATLIAMIIGFILLLQPIVVLADVVPMFGTIVGFGIGLIGAITGIVVWTLATILAWFAVRPLMALILIVLVTALIWWLFARRHRNQNLTKA